MAKETRRNFQKKMLCRKVNTTCHGGKVYHGNNTNYSRSKKESIEQKAKMKSGNQRHGLDFTPLYRFLLKNVGKNWNILHSEIKSRLPKDLRFDPLENVVLSFDEYEYLKENEELKGYVRTGESSKFSQFYIDKEENLQLVFPELTVSDFKVSCDCCTHTFNGSVIKGKAKV